MTSNGHVGASAFVPAPRRIAEYTIEGFGTFYLRSLTEQERSEWESEHLDAHGMYDRSKAYRQKPSLIMRMVCDKDGDLLLPTDCLKNLLGMDSSVTSALYDACLQHLGTATIEEAVKN